MKAPTYLRWAAAIAIGCVGVRQAAIGHYIHTNHVVVQLYESKDVTVVGFEMTGRNLLPYPVEGYMDWNHRVHVRLSGDGEPLQY